MALTTQITIPQVALPVGPMTFMSGVLPAGQKKWTLTIVPVVWPLSGSVIELMVEESQDGGATWVFSASVDFSAPVIDRFGNPLPSIVWNTDSMFSGTNCRVRVNVNVLQACTISGTLQTQ